MNLEFYSRFKGFNGFRRFMGLVQWVQGVRGVQGLGSEVQGARRGGEVVAVVHSEGWPFAGI
jgi:hypothetical protein